MGQVPLIDLISMDTSVLEAVPVFDGPVQAEDYCVVIGYIVLVVSAWRDTCLLYTSPSPRD
eukprot:14702091-Alexandrium_andersonii.AAC.1